MKVNFAGRERTLRFRPSHGALFEDHMGATITESLGKMGTRTLATLLWLGLRHEDDRLTPAKVLDGIDDYVTEGGDLTDLWHAVSTQLGADGLFGKQAQDKAGKGAA